ncbi:transporter substrate-binding domain-containing protein [Chloroflexi bacterium TSY]|nr:transporter substrate-binding domain-containing protein [Chloroflexi bacterium TSY]
MLLHRIQFFGLLIGLVSIFLAGCEQGAVALQAPADQPSVLEEILETGVLKVGTTGDFNPMSFKNPDTDEYVGHDIELVTQLATDMGVEIEFVPTDWANLVSGVAAGKYHITTGASMNMGRAKTAGYTLPIVEVGTVPLMLRENEGKYNSWAEINSPGTVVAVTLGTVFDEQARALFPEAEITAVESPARDFQEVLAGRADVSITSNIEASQLIQTYSELMVVPVDGPRNANAIALLAPQKDQVLINYINVWITMKTKSGWLEELRAKWLALE